jgi:hypothetical protein
VPHATYVLRWHAKHRAFRLKAALLHEPGVGTVDVTFHIRDAVAAEKAPATVA